MSIGIKSIIGILAAVTIAAGTSAAAQTPSSDTVRIGYQKSSTLTAILKTNGVLEKALVPLGVQVSWSPETWW
jgi:sulfonate transport system substrate-binding protein